MTGKEIFVLACFIAVPLVLLLFHIFLSYREKPTYGLVVPIVWGIISFFVIRSGTGENVIEMIIFMYGIDAVLLGMWAGIRYLRYKKHGKADYPRGKKK